ncbi:hypothetical protein ABFT23_18295 [Nocardioides sp. C4-1]|uniref:hypothetical protein n=1 Tax=Nocardioides sp. C4-1 TaxID=3151851 RepID=UPI003262FA4F
MRRALPAALVGALTAGLLSLVPLAAPATAADDDPPPPPALTARTIEIAEPSDPLVATQTWTPVVTATTGALDGDAVTFTTDDDTVCEPGAAAGTIELHQALPCEVTATIAEGDAYLGASDSIEVTAGLLPQDVELDAPTSRVVGVPWEPVVRSDTDGTPTFTSTTPDACRPTTDGTAVDLLTAGAECSVTATVAGVEHVRDAGTSDPVVFTVAARPVTLTVAVSDPHRYRDTVTITVTATDTGGGTPPAATIAGTGTILVGSETATTGGPMHVTWTGGVATREITAPRPGSVPIAVSMQPTPASAYGLATTTTAVEVGRAEQTATFAERPAISADRPGTAYVGDTWDPAASLAPASVSGDAARAVVITAASSSSAVCTVSGRTVSFTGAGRCDLTASHPATTEYDAAPTVSTHVDVSRRPVEIVYTVTPTVVAGSAPKHGDTVTISAVAVDGVDGTTRIAGTGAIAVTHTSVTTPGTPATVTPGSGASATAVAPALWGVTQSFTGVGSQAYTARASFTAGDTVRYAPYTTGTETAVVPVARTTQSLAWGTGDDAPPTSSDADEAWTPVVRRGETAADVVVTAAPSTVCTVVDDEVRFVGAGSCVVTATQEGDEHYLRAEITTPVRVDLRQVTVALAVSKASPVYGDSVVVTATVTDDRDATRRLSGTGTLTASKGLLPVAGLPLTFVDGTATATVDDLPVVTDSLLRGTFAPVDDEDAVYETAHGDRLLTVTRAPQTIVPPTGVDTSVHVRDTASVLATGGGSGKPVTGSLPPGTTTCSVANPTVAGQPVVVTFLREGSCPLLLDQEGGTNHLPAEQDDTVVFAVSKRPVRVEVTTDPPDVFFGTDVAVTVKVLDAADTADPGAPAPGVVAVTVPGVTGVTSTSTPTAGTTVVRYRVPRAGRQALVVRFTPTDGVAFEAVVEGGPQSDQHVDSRPLPQTVTFDDTTRPSPAYATKTWTPELDGTAGGGGFTLEPRAAADGVVHCTVTGPEVRFTTPGDCVLDAYQDAVSGQYDRSPARRITVTVTALPYRITLTQPPSGVVGTTVLVSGFARDVAAGSLKRVEGSGRLTLQRLADPDDPTSWTRVASLPADPTAPAVTWPAGGPLLTYIPTRAGTYRVVATFTPADAPAHSLVGTTGPTPATFEVSQGPTVVTPLITRVVTPPLTTPATPIAPPTSTTVLEQWRMVPTGGGSVHPVVTEVGPGTLPADTCTVSGPAGAQVVDFVRIGTCVLQVSQEGDESYADDDADPVTITVGAASTRVSIVGQTVAQAVVGVEHQITVTATSVSNGRPVRGRFVLTTDTGVELRQPSDPTATGTSATFGFVPQTTGALQVQVRFEPADAANVLTSSVPVSLDVLPGTQRMSVAPVPASNASYVGDGPWDLAAVIDHGPPGAKPRVVVLPDTSGTPDSSGVVPARCSYDATTGKVSLLRAGTCTVQVSTPDVDGWVSAPTVTHSFQVRINTTRLVLTLVPAGGRENAFVDEDFTISAEAIGSDSGTTDVAVPGTIELELVDPDAPADAPAIWTATRDSGAGRIDLPASLDHVGSYTLRGSLVPSDGLTWAASDGEATVSVVREPQALVIPDGTVPASLPVLTTWRSPIVSTGGIAATVTTRTPAICRVEGRDVTMVADGDCELTFAVPESRLYEETAEVPALVETRSLTTDVSVSRPEPGVVGEDHRITAVVTARRPDLPPRLDVREAESLPQMTGHVVFSITGRAAPIGSVPVSVPAGGTRPVSIQWTPDASTFNNRAKNVTAELVVDEPGDLVTWTSPDDDASSPLDIARGTPDLDVTVSHDAGDPTDQVTVTATMTFTGTTLPATIGGTVAFETTQYRLNESRPIVVATEGGRTRATATLVTSKIPAGAAVRLTANYLGNDDVAEASAEVDRGIPTVTRSAAAVPTGWQRGPVTFTYTCAPAGSPIIGRCPSAVTVSGDGVRRSTSFAAVAEDGGTVFVQTPAVDIDATAPTLQIRDIKPGEVHPGPARSAVCVAGDATSGLAGCTITTTRVDREVRRVVARATDKAGNVSTASLTYRELQEWVVGAPRDRAGRFAVTPGKRIRVETITRGAKRRPALVVRAPGGGWKRVSTMVATRQRDGFYTWSATYTLPRKWTPSTRVGIRTGSTTKVLGLVRR